MLIWGQKRYLVWSAEEISSRQKLNEISSCRKDLLGSNLIAEKGISDINDDWRTWNDSWLLIREQKRYLVWSAKEFSSRLKLNEISSRRKDLLGSNLIAEEELSDINDDWRTWNDSWSLIREQKRYLVCFAEEISSRLKLNEISSRRKDLLGSNLIAEEELSDINDDWRTWNDSWLLIREQKRYLVCLPQRSFFDVT